VAVLFVIEPRTPIMATADLHDCFASFVSAPSTFASLATYLLGSVEPLSVEVLHFCLENNDVRVLWNKLKKNFPGERKTEEQIESFLDTKKYQLIQKGLWLKKSQLKENERVE